MDNQSKEFSLEEVQRIARRARKYKGALLVPSGNIEDFVESKSGRAFVDNDWKLFLPVDIQENAAGEN